MTRINLADAVRTAEQSERIADISAKLDAAQASGRISADDREQIMSQFGAAFDTTTEDNVGFLRGLLGLKER